jgi:hypothetical protein
MDVGRTVIAIKYLVELVEQRAGSKEGGTKLRDASKIESPVRRLMVRGDRFAPYQAVLTIALHRCGVLLRQEVPRNGIPESPGQIAGKLGSARKPFSRTGPVEVSSPIEEVDAGS